MELVMIVEQELGLFRLGNCCRFQFVPEFNRRTKYGLENMPFHWTIRKANLFG